MITVRCWSDYGCCGRLGHEVYSVHADVWCLSHRYTEEGDPPQNRDTADVKEGTCLRMGTANMKEGTHTRMGTADVKEGTTPERGHN